MHRCITYTLTLAPAVNESEIDEAFRGQGTMQCRSHAYAWEAVVRPALCMPVSASGVVAPTASCTCRCRPWPAYAERRSGETGHRAHVLSASSGTRHAPAP